MKALRRVFKYVWPQWPRLVTILCSAVLIAILFSVSVATVLPLLKVMMGEEGLHGWVYRKISEGRYGFEFYVHDRIELSDPNNPQVAYYLRVVGVKNKSFAEASGIMVDDLICGAIDLARSGGPRTFQLVLERGSTFYYPLKLFERFEFPYIKKMVEAFVAGGLTPVLHLDNDWTKNLPYFKELPKGKCACELDSTTDIFKAKEILRDHICIKGDVPASLLSLGTPEQVTTYCKKLIDVVGEGGGFILSTGCNCPIDAKFENVKAMIDTAKNYLPSK